MSKPVAHSMRHACTAGLLSASTLALVACGGSSGGPVVAANTKASLALLETTDLHTNVMSYDYFKLAEDTSLGYERVATLINKARAEFAKGNPQGRIVQPAEVADTVRWLCAESASAITGQSIAVCGGEVMH